MSTVGVNGKVLVYDPDSPWKTWALQEIYLGTVTSGKYVPKLNDWVRDITTAELFRVTSLDITTYIPVLESVVEVNTGENIDDYDIILGQGPGSVYDTHRAFLDTSVRPYSLALEHRNYIHGTMAKYAKIFRGTLSEGGDYHVISAFYDPSGNLLGDSVPLELVAMPNGMNYATYAVPPCKTIEDMPNGEVVTVVIYSDTGHVVSKSKYIIERTAYIRAVNSSTKYITNISLKSDFISGSDPNVILYPINVPLNSLNLIGVVHYSDGSTVELPVDGTRFKVFGLANFVATVVGQEIPVVLCYTLAADEAAYGTTVGATHTLTETYTAKTVEADGQYAVKLFGYPVWQDPVNGYKLQWYLMNLDRETFYDVTPYVQFNANSPAYNPALYGVVQRLSVSLNLQSVSGSFKSYVHTQTMDLSLKNQGTEPPTNWTIAFEPGQDPVFGTDNQVKMTYENANLSYLDITCGATTQEEWLNKLFYYTKPLINPDNEVTPPTPDFMVLMIGGTETTLPVTDWQNTITINTVLANNSTLFIRFIKRTVDNDIQLAIAGIPVHQVN